MFADPINLPVLASLSLDASSSVTARAYQLNVRSVNRAGDFDNSSLGIRSRRTGMFLADIQPFDYNPILAGDDPQDPASLTPFIARDDFDSVTLPHMHFTGHGNDLLP